MKIHSVTLNPSVDRVMQLQDFDVGGHFAARRTLLVPAGKGINVGRFLKALGADPYVWALVGRRELPLFREMLARSGIRARLYPVRGGTRQNITIMCPGKPDTHIREPGFQVAEREWKMLLSDLVQAAPPGDFVSFSGSFPRGLDGRHLNLMLGSLPGRKIFLDLNGVAADPSSAPPDTPLTIKINSEEFRQLAGTPSNETALRAFLSENPSVERVIVTDGPRRILWCDRSVVLAAVPPKVSPKAAVGAGDAFMAGMLAALSDGLPPEQCLRRAAAAGTASTLEPLVGDIDPEKVRRLEAEVEVSYP